MNVLPPHQLADLWYLKFGHAWIFRSALDKDWKNISSKLMQSNLVDYDLVYGDPTNNKVGLEEIVKLKETCR